MTTPLHQPTTVDHRPELAASLAWTGSRIAGVRPDQLDLPTPCTEYDVRTLIGHLYAVAGRMEAMGRGLRAEDQPRIVTDLDADHLGQGFTERATAAQAAWADDATLTSMVSAPWGEVTGAAMLDGYVSEVLVHGWDLAIATDQDSKADAASRRPGLLWRGSRYRRRPAVGPFPSRRPSYRPPTPGRTSGWPTTWAEPACGSGWGRAGKVRTVIDIRFVRDNPDVVRQSQLARGEDPATVDVLLAADEARRSAVHAFEEIRGEQKTLGTSIKQATADTRSALLGRAKGLAAEVKAAEASVTDAEAALDVAHRAVPNVIVTGVPAGGEENFVTLETIGSPPELDFAAQDHEDIGNALGAFDIPRGAKVSGARFYFLTGIGAQLEFALINLAMAQALGAGFTPVIAPALVRPEAMDGTGFLGQHEEEVYKVERDDLYLVGTSEVALAGMHSGEILDLSGGPKRYAGFSSCFRREAGSYGKDTKGVFRVHWFDKVEMFTYTTEEDSYAEHQRLLEWEKEFLTSLEVSFRVIDVAAGDLGSSAARKFDCEAWFPSQQRYRELTSTSNCTTYQARRLGIRYRDADGKPRPAATLNGTLCAITRTIACLLDHHQQKDGSVRVPAALQPYLGGLEVLEPTGH